MSERPRAPAAKGRDHAQLLLLSALWGGSFFLIKLAVAGFPPLWVAAIRITLGGLALLLLLRLRGLSLPSGRGVWARLAFMGIVGNLAPFALIAWGELQVASGLAAILMAMVPLLVVVMAHFLVADEPLTFPRMLGVSFGIAGIVLLIGPSALAGLRGHVAAQLAILLGTACYAGSAVVARGLPPMGADAASAGVLLVAAPVALITAALLDPPARASRPGSSLSSPSHRSESSAPALAICCSCASFAAPARASPR